MSLIGRLRYRQLRRIAFAAAGFLLLLAFTACGVTIKANLGQRPGLQGLQALDLEASAKLMIQNGAPQMTVENYLRTHGVPEYLVRSTYEQIVARCKECQQIRVIEEDGR